MPTRRRASFIPSWATPWRIPRRPWRSLAAKLVMDPARHTWKRGAVRTPFLSASPRIPTPRSRSAMRLASPATPRAIKCSGEAVHTSRGLWHVWTAITVHYGSPAERYAELGFCDSRYGTPLTEHVGTKKPQPELCLQCHQMRRAQLQRSSHMPYREGKVTCTSCHNPHGSPNPSQLLQSIDQRELHQLPYRTPGSISVGASSGHGKLRQLPRAPRQQQSAVTEGPDATGLRLLPRCEPPPHTTAAAWFHQELQPGVHQLPLINSRIEPPLG